MWDEINVLFVDDEQKILNAMRRTFRTQPWRLHFAGSAEEALELIDSVGKVDLVVTDQKMPGMSGVELLSILRKRHPATVRMLVSAYSDAATVLDAINEGFVYKYLTKSCSEQVLKETIVEIVTAIGLRRENQQLASKLEENEREIEAVDSIMGELDELEFDTAEIPMADTVLENLPMGVIVSVDGRVAMANAEARRLVPVNNGDGLTGALTGDLNLETSDEMEVSQQELPELSEGADNAIYLLKGR